MGDDLPPITNLKKTSDRGHGGFVNQVGGVCRQRHARLASGSHSGRGVRIRSDFLLGRRHFQETLIRELQNDRVKTSCPNCIIIAAERATVTSLPYNVQADGTPTVAHCVGSGHLVLDA